MSLPLLIGGVCIVTSIIGTYRRCGSDRASIMGALYKGFWTGDPVVPALYRASHGRWATCTRHRHDRGGVAITA